VEHVSSQRYAIALKDITALSVNYVCRVELSVINGNIAICAAGCYNGANCTSPSNCTCVTGWEGPICTIRM
jgi:hypothetical protein